MLKLKAQRDGDWKENWNKRVSSKLASNKMKNLMKIIVICGSTGSG